MLFGRRRKHGALPPNSRERDADESAIWPHRRQMNPGPDLVRIDFEMMQKGHIIQRGKVKCRQCGVTVAGSTRLVTSGDVVDRETYEALLASGIIRPAPASSAKQRDARDES